MQDVLLLTLVPVGLTMGKPLSLWRRGRTKATEAASAGLAAAGTRLLRMLTFPLMGSLLAMTLLLLIYTTGRDAARLDSPALLEVTRVALMAAGCLFLWPLLGVDGESGFASYPVRALIAIVDGLLDAVPGLAVMGTGGVIARAHYEHVARSWHPSLIKDQQIGALAMIGLSELVGLPALLLLLVGWVRSDTRQALDVDRSLDERTGPAVSACPGGASVGNDRHLPWWILEPGPLAERAARDGWQVDPAASPPKSAVRPTNTGRESP